MNMRLTINNSIQRCIFEENKIEMCWHEVCFSLVDSVTSPLSIKINAKLVYQKCFKLVTYYEKPVSIANSCCKNVPRYTFEISLSNIFSHLFHVVLIFKLFCRLSERCSCIRPRHSGTRSGRPVPSLLEKALSWNGSRWGRRPVNGGLFAASWICLHPRKPASEICRHSSVLGCWDKWAIFYISFKTRSDLEQNWTWWPLI